MLKRRVRFETDNLEVQVVGPLLRPSSEMSETEKSTIWWRESDYREFERNAKEISDAVFFQDNFKNVQPTEESTCFVSTMTQTYRACRSTPKFIKKEGILCPATKMKLEELNRDSARFRGLEYHSVPFLVEAKRRNRESCIKCFLELQKRMNESDLYDANMKSEFLSNFLKKRSECARLFAKVMGEADAATVLNEASFALLKCVVAPRSA